MNYYFWIGAFVGSVLTTISYRVWAAVGHAKNARYAAAASAWPCVCGHGSGDHIGGACVGLPDVDDSKPLCACTWFTAAGFKD